MNGRAAWRRVARSAASLLLNMAKSDPNDFWGKGNPSEPPSDPNAGFWSGAKKPEKPEQQPKPAEKPAPKPVEQPEGGFWGKRPEPVPRAEPSKAEPSKAEPSKP